MEIGHTATQQVCTAPPHVRLLSPVVFLHLLGSQQPGKYESVGEVAALRWKSIITLLSLRYWY